MIDWTDELAYSTADLDDGYEAHLVTLEQINEGVPVFARFFGEVRKLYPGAAPKLQFNEVLRRILDRWVGDLIRNTQTEVKAAGPEAPDDVRSYSWRLAGLSPEAESERRRTKEFLYQNLYNCRSLEPEKEAAERIISNLFELWMKHPEKLPTGYQEKADAEPLARVICDYIAGMTDPYIYEQYEKHCG